MENISKFVIWNCSEVRYACRLQSFYGFESMELFEEGISLSNIFPLDSYFEMNDDFPFNLLLTDTLYNLHDLIIASSKEKAFLETKNIANIEYLPVTIMNHKGKPVDTTYFIIHPIHPIDCLDLAACDVVWSEIDSNVIENVTQLAIDENKINSTLNVVRIKHLGRVIAIRRTLAQALDSEGFTGNKWLEFNEFSD